LITVSVLTASYNQQKYIERCLQSVSNQSFMAIEQILVDDGSTDATLEVARSQRNPRLKTIQLAHRGLEKLSETYNAGLREAQGDLIAILEGDDCWESRKLEKQIPLFEDPDVVLVHSGSWLMDDQGKTIGKVCLQRPSKESALSWLLEGNRITAPTVLIRRDALEKIGGFLQKPYLPVVDYPTWLILSTIGTFAYLNEPLSFYRVHSSMSTLIRSAAIFPGAARLASEFCQSVQRDFPALFTGIDIDHLSRLWADMEAHGYWLQGKLSLHQHEWERARQSLWKARKVQKISHRKMLLINIGLLCVTLRIDPNAAMKLMNRGLPS